MISTSQEYRASITGDFRRILLKAIVDIIDPDIVFGTAHGSRQAAFSQPDQLRDRVFDLTPYATLERNRWRLNGRMKIMPAGGPLGETGWVSGALSGDDCAFSEAQCVELRFSNVSILQACSIYFPKEPQDGVAADFTVDVLQGGTSYYSKTFTGNQASFVALTGFTVQNPDAIRVTVTKWSLPGRRMRVAEISPGIFEEWDSSVIAAFSVVQQANFSCLALPYGTCTLKMDNLARRFEPRSKDGVFQSIEERQGIDVSIGVRTEAGDQYIHVGKFYQYSGGWKTGDNGLSMQWDLVDVVGLLADRQFLPPDTLPTTLGGWAAALVAQLGSNFKDLYTVDTDYAGIGLTASKADVAGKKCGEIMRFACMATGTWPRADAETGYLAFEPFWNQGNQLTLDNLASYPVMKANDDLAAIIFTLNDGNGTEYVVSGNSTASSNTVSVNNPFIRTEEQALTAAKMILSTYGGNKLETTGRGDPSSEIGDVDTVWLNGSSATTGRRQMQSFQIQNGVLQNCRSIFLQADGSFLFSNWAVITQSGRWTAPTGVSKLRYIIVGPGFDGQSGTDGTWDEAGVDGADGAGGLVLSGTRSINNGQVFQVSISDTETTFGVLSSASGASYPYGFTDVASGNSYGRTGVPKPLSGSGDGGAGGRGGAKGHYRTVTKQDADGTTTTKTVVDNRPGQGRPGAAGATGCVVLYWEVD